jgi:cytochrome c553
MKPAARVLSGLIFALTGMCAHSAEPPPPAKADLSRGEAISNGVCVACHANDGSRGNPAYPILQGQHADYLVKQLTEYKAGKRQNAIMSGIASTLSDADMKNVAAFYAGKQAKAGFAKDKDLAIAGEKIYRGGIAAPGLPACAGCHGPSGAGIPVQYPRLSGQHAEYVEAQLLMFRSGGRHNNVAMNQIAAKLGDHDIKALADYVSGLR